MTQFIITLNANDPPELALVNRILRYIGRTSLTYIVQTRIISIENLQRHKHVSGLKQE